MHKMPQQMQTSIAQRQQKETNSHLDKKRQRPQLSSEPTCLRAGTSVYPKKQMFRTNPVIQISSLR